MTDKQTPEQQLEAIKKLVNQHEDQLGRYYAMDLPTATQKMLELYEHTSTDALAGVKAFRDDAVSWLRALSMVAEMVGNGGTHAEKAARLRGMVEMIETIIGKLRDQQFDFNSQYYRWPDLFHSDYPVRRYMERAHDAERQAKEATRVAKRYEIALSLVGEVHRAYFETALVDAEKKLEGEKEFDPARQREGDIPW